jgi:hypothetical protein
MSTSTSERSLACPEQMLMLDVDVETLLATVDCPKAQP